MSHIVIDPGAADRAGGVPGRHLHREVQGWRRLLRDAGQPREHRH